MTGQNFDGKLTEDRYPRCPDCGNAVVGASMTLKSHVLDGERLYPIEAFSVYCQHCEYDQPHLKLLNDPPKEANATS